MLYVFALIFALIFASYPVRFWLAVNRMRRLDAAMRADPHMFAMDGVAVYLAAGVMYYAAHAWFGFTLPFLRIGAPWANELMAVLLSIACLVVIATNCRQRWNDATRSRAGMPEAVLRWLATRQIITAAEVAGELHRHGRIEL
jgi:hypothetical protein